MGKKAWIHTTHPRLTLNGREYYNFGMHVTPNASETFFVTPTVHRHAHQHQQTSHQVSNELDHSDGGGLLWKGYKRQLTDRRTDNLPPTSTSTSSQRAPVQLELKHLSTRNRQKNNGKFWHWTLKMWSGTSGASSLNCNNIRIQEIYPCEKLRTGTIHIATFPCKVWISWMQ